MTDNRTPGQQETLREYEARIAALEAKLASVESTISQTGQAATAGRNWKDWFERYGLCLLYTSPSPRDLSTSRMPSSA